MDKNSSNAQTEEGENNAQATKKSKLSLSTKTGKILGGILVSTISGILVALFVFVLYNRNSRDIPVINESVDRKAISLTAIANEYIFKMSEEAYAIDDLEIYYDGQPLTSPAIVRIAVSNYGSVDIDEKDFIEPIVISLMAFDDYTGEKVDVEIYNWSIESGISDEFNESTAELVSIENQKIKIQALTLCKYESFTIRLVANTTIDHASASVRITGIDIKDTDLDFWNWDEDWEEYWGADYSEKRTFSKEVFGFIVFPFLVLLLVWFGVDSLLDYRKTKRTLHIVAAIIFFFVTAGAVMAFVYSYFLRFNVYYY